MSGGTASTVAVYMTVGFAANALLGFFVLSRDEKAPANRLYAAFVFLVAWWALAKLGVSLSADADTAAVWYKLSAFGWLLMPPVYLQFVGVYTGRRIFGGATRPVFAVLYGVAAALFVGAWLDGLIVRRMIVSDWGFTHEPGPLYRFVFAPWLLALFLLGLYHLVAFTVRAPTRGDRTRGILLIIGIVVPFVGGAITNMILPVVGRHVPGLAIPLTTVNAVIVAYAMVRYRLLSITVEFAAGTIITTMPDALLVLDARGSVVVINPALQRLTGLSAAELKGRPIGELVPDVRFDDLRRQLAADGEARLDVELAARDGDRIPVSVSVSRLRDPKGRTAGYVCVGKDMREVRALIARIEEANAELARLAVTDPLTGAFNRRYLERRLEEELLRAGRYGTRFSVVAVDLDRFKEVNDSLGHAVGDRVLREVGALFLRELRSPDIVVRPGGDEFLLLLPETPAERAVEVAERLRAALELTPADGAPPGSASFGVAEFDPHRPPERAEDLLVRADQALYEAKRLGRNRVVLWSPALDPPGAATPARSAWSAGRAT